MTRGSVPWVVRGIREWAVSARQGMALVTWKSIRARDDAVAELSSDFEKLGWKTETFHCSRYSTPEFIRALASSRADALFVLDPDILIFGEGEDRSPGWLNFQREAIVERPGVQVWWMPADAAIRFGRDLPDLVRFFLYREELAEEPDVRPRVLPQIERRPPDPRAAPWAKFWLGRSRSDRATPWVAGLMAVGNYLRADDPASADLVFQDFTQSLGAPEDALRDSDFPLLPPLWLELGDFYYSRALREDNREFGTRAADCYRASMAAIKQADPGFLSAYTVWRLEARLGDISSKFLNLPEKAVEHYRRAVSDALNGEAQAPILLSLGEVLASLGRNDEARDAFESVVEPTTAGRLRAQAFSRLSALEYSLGRLEHAREYLMNAIRLSETLPETAAVREDLLEYYLALGEIAGDRGAFDKAREIAEALLREHPDCPEYQRNLELVMRHYEAHAFRDG